VFVLVNSLLNVGRMNVFSCRSEVVERLRGSFSIRCRLDEDCSRKATAKY
jgi:hypothetical protein